MDCPACGRSLAADLISLSPELPFAFAAEEWLKAHSAYVKPRTVKDYEQYIEALNSFFMTLPLNKIHIGHIRNYHKMRLLPPGVKKMEGRAGASRVRMESSTLRQIMREAGCWEKIRPLYKHPRLTKREKEGAGKSFTREQEEIFVSVGLELPRCELAAHCANVMFKSGFGFGELSKVRRYEFDVEERTVEITEGAKGEGERERIVPLTESAFQSMMWILQRWEDAGGSSEDDFLLFYRGPDFSKPMVSIQNAWNRITAECIARKLLPPSFRRRIYDCRVTAITKALSSRKVSLHTARKLFGHVSKKMQKRYYKPEMDILREAVEALELPPKKQPVSIAVQKSETSEKKLSG
jgi:integrase